MFEGQNSLTSVQQYDASQLVSIDKAAVDACNMNRSFGWSYRGASAIVEVSYEQGKR